MSCEKKRYWLAEDAMMAAIYNHEHFGFPLQEVYYCNKCGEYHLKSIDKKKEINHGKHGN